MAGFFQGKVALVTGAGRGIGRACALAFARAGAKVVGVSRTPRELDAVAETIRGLGAEVLTLSANIADEKEVLRVFQVVRDRWGPVDVLVNNAAIFIRELLADQTTQAWDEVFGVNVRGMMLCSREVLRDCRKTGRPASIVNIASLSGVRGPEKFPGFAAYTASKYAVVGLSECLAVEGRPLGVRVNCLAPGAVDTDMLRRAAPQLRTQTTPDQIARTVLQLADSDQSGHVHNALVEIFSNLPEPV